MRMTRALAGMFALVCGAVVLAAQEPQDWRWAHAVTMGLTQERMVGLLNIPGTASWTGCGEVERKVGDLYARPSTARPAIGALSCMGVDLMIRRPGESGAERVPSDESDYEVPAAVVYQRSGRWFRIALLRGSAWTAPENPKDFEVYPELLLGDEVGSRLTYVRKGWSGRLWTTPDTGTPRRVAAAWRPHLADDIPVTVLGVRRLARGNVWIHVRLESESCGEPAFPTAGPRTGWIPAYNASNRPTVWFYSRGC